MYLTITFKETVRFQPYSMGSHRGYRHKTIMHAYIFIYKCLAQLSLIACKNIQYELESAPVSTLHVYFFCMTPSGDAVLSKNKRIIHAKPFVNSK